VTSLLHRGARPTAVDGLRRTPLHHAVRRRLLSVSEKLLRHKAAPNFRDVNGVTPFAIALEQLDDDHAALLLDFMENAV
jgi:ankyrin repeat protein